MTHYKTNNINYKGSTLDYCDQCGYWVKFPCETNDDMEMCDLWDDELVDVDSDRE